MFFCSAGVSATGIVVCTETYVWTCGISFAVYISDLGLNSGLCVVFPCSHMCVWDFSKLGV